jgi:hypothetical protein
MIKKQDHSQMYQIQRLLPRHFKMLDLKLEGIPNREIAKILDCSEGNVHTVTRSPLFLRELNERMKKRNDDAVHHETEAHLGKVRSILEQNAEKAANTQVDLLDSEDDGVRLRSSNSIMDRVLGRTDVVATAGTSINVQINAEKAQLLNVALQESLEINALPQKEFSNAENAESATD